MDPNNKWNRWLLAGALPVIVGLFYISASGHFGYTPDDTYIYLQFAKNIIHGDGMAFNAGHPTYGFTSPLWLFIISAGGKLGVDLFYAAKVIDLLFASLGIVVFYLVAFETIRDVATSLCATVAFSVNAWFLRWAGTGMETSLALILVLAVVLYCLRNEYFVSIFFAALAFVVRPETVILPFLVVIDLFVNSYSRKRAVQTAAALALMYVALIAPWFIAAYRTFGTIIPNTFFAKSGIHPGFEALLATAADIGKTVGATDGIAAVVMLLAGGFLLVILTRHNANLGEEVRQARFFLMRQSIIGVGWLVVLPAIYRLTDVNVMSRYLLLITPFITIYAFSFLHKAVENSSLRKHVYTAAFVLTAFVLVQNQLVYRAYVKPGMDAFQVGMSSCLIPIAVWFRENTPADATLLAPDIGALGYYSGRTVLDAAGLASPEFIPLLRQGLSPDSIIAKRLFGNMGDVDFVVQRSTMPGVQIPGDSLQPLFAKPFYGLTIQDPHLTYYTVYKVQRTPSEVIR